MLARLAVWGPILAFTAHTAHRQLDRLREAQLSHRLAAFYAMHAPDRSVPEAGRLLAQHGSIEALDDALSVKYGASLPPEDLFTLALADDLVGAGVYLAWRAASRPAEALAAHLPAWARPDRLVPMDLPATALRRWQAVPTGTRLGASAVACSALRLLLPSVMRLPLLALWSAVAWTSVPAPTDLSPAELWTHLSEAWVGELTADWPRTVLQRLAINSGCALVAAAVAGPAHATPILGTWLLGALVASTPPPEADLVLMGYVLPSARGALRGAIGQKPALLQQYHFGIARVITLNSDRAGWEAPMVAVGALGRWVSLTTIATTGSGANQKLHGSGVLLPVSSVPLTLTFLLLLCAAIANDHEATAGAGRATVMLLLVAIASFVALAVLVLSA
jgi:hypothetical protein